MVDEIEQAVYKLVRKYTGSYIFSIKEVSLSLDTDLDTDLDIDELMVNELMDEFFVTFQVERGSFNLKKYFPDTSPCWNPFKKPDPVRVPDLTIDMLVRSARAGKWLYD